MKEGLAGGLVVSVGEGLCEAVFKLESLQKGEPGVKRHEGSSQAKGEERARYILRIPGG